MNDLNDLYFFVSVVQYKGFSAAARAIRIEKTRLSRRIAALERDLGVRLLQRSTRSVALTEAGERFYERCQAVVAGAQAAYDDVSELQKEPSGNVRISCPVVLAQSYLAPVLPGYMAMHPKVSVFIEASDRAVNVLEERFDLALRARTVVDNAAGLVAKELGRARRILVASPAFLDRRGRPSHPSELSEIETITRISDCHDGVARWELRNESGQREEVRTVPRLVSSDLGVQFEAATHGIGIAMMPEPLVARALRAKELEHALPEWSATADIIHLIYPRPRGMLPSVRSLIDYLLIHVPASIMNRSI